MVVRMRALQLSLILLSCSLTLAQQPACMAGHDMAGMKPAELLPPPQHMTGIGNASVDITSSSPEAKVWFNQGLNLLHDFWDYESVRAFEQSIKSDPQCAMCWWGLHEAQGFRGNDDKTITKQSLSNAKKFSKHATEAEKLYIKAATQSDHSHGRKPGDEDPQKDSSETKTLRKLVAISPQDTHAKVLLAESLLTGFKKNGDPRAGTVAGQAVLAQVLIDHPDDSAANHYWIHAVEPGNHPELALVSARKLGSLASASGHMVHMPGHIFYRTGDYESARVSFQNSMDVDATYMQTQHVKVDDDWNYVHNMMYLIADLLEQGRMAQASLVSEKLNSARGDTLSTLYVYSTRDGLTRLNVALPVALRTGDWSRASAMLEASAPDKSLSNLVWVRSALLDYTLGMKALEAGNTTEAAKHLDSLNAALKVKPEDSKMGGMRMPKSATPPAFSKDLLAHPAHNFVDVAALELEGSILTAQNKPTEADAAFKKAAEAEVALGYHEPPSYIRPVGETRGDALLRAGRTGEARQAFEQALKDRPNSGYPLYGLARTSAATKDDAQTTAAYARLLATWTLADPTLSQLQEAHAWIDRHPSSTQNHSVSRTPKTHSAAS